MKLVLDNPKDIKALRRILFRDIQAEYEEDAFGHSTRHGLSTWSSVPKEIETLIHIAQLLGISKQAFLRAAATRRDEVDKYHRENHIDFDSLWDPMVVLVKQARSAR